MGEYARTDNYQLVDSEIVIVIDTVTGETHRFADNFSATGTMEQAIEYIETCHGFHDRMAVVKLP